MYYMLVRSSGCLNHIKGTIIIIFMAHKAAGGNIEAKQCLFNNYYYYYYYY